MLYILLINIFVLFTTTGLGQAQPLNALEPKPKLPIVFHEKYDISLLFGLEKLLHPFDGAKYGRVYHHVLQHCNLSADQFYTPALVSDQDLLKVHTQRYLDSLKSSTTIASIAEVAPLLCLPISFLNWKLLTPMKYATGGTILATQLALKEGWAFNLSGGYHHAKADRGSGFCVYADIPLAIKIVHETQPDLKVLIVDLDAHQGNGHEAMLGNDPRVAFFDVYTDGIFPNDYEAQRFITFNHPVRRGIADKEYLRILENDLPAALATFQPNLIIYNAGTDIFEKDRLGQMAVTAQGIIKRDQFVFACARTKKIPIVMVLSGGYTQQSAEIIGLSIENILKNVIGIG